MYNNKNNNTQKNINNINNKQYSKSYKIIKQIGQGGYSTIYEAEKYEDGCYTSPIMKEDQYINLYNKDKKKVAIKRITKISDSTKLTTIFTDENTAITVDEGIELNCIRELTVLKHLSHSNLLYSEDIFYYNACIHIVMPYYEHNLTYFYNKPALDLKEIKYIMYSLCKGLEYLHSKGIIHRDLKPENVLISFIGLNSYINDMADSKNRINFKIVIADFGLSRYISNNSMTPNVVSRWYRPPELLLGSNSYNYSVDVWCLGLLLAELVIKRVLFKGGSDIEQLHLYYKSICSVGGKDDTTEDIIWLNKLSEAKGGFRYVYKEGNNNMNLRALIITYINNTNNKHNIEHLSSTIELICECLKLDPRKRPTVRSILSMGYFGMTIDSNNK
ncbi:putative CTD kinase subunit alpha like protein [Cucumispora dikerogammari]|nr:putative CTD kinase subunit alpha like protein [Cucumispora dikerogammari]